MPFEAQVEKSITRQVKQVFPEHTNHIGTLFGGYALLWMDEVAALTAARFSRQQYVTVSLDRIDFKQPIPEGSIIELIGRVARVGRTSVQTMVEIWIEQVSDGSRVKGIAGTFTMVAVDEARKPIPVRLD